MIGRMVEFAVRDIPRDEWRRLGAGFAERSLMQCWEYGEAKARTGAWRVERGVFLDGGEPVGMVQALVRPLPLGLPGGLVWINRGPLWRPMEGNADDPARYGALMAALRRHYVLGRSMYLRLAPPLAEGDLPRDAVTAAGFAPTATPGWASAILDLSPPVDDLRKGLKQKWRNCLNKAERSDLAVEAGCGDDLFAVFLDGHRQLTAKGDFSTSVTAESLAALQALLPGGGRMTAFLAYHGDAPVASVLMARYGDTGEYLAGNVGSEGRRLNAGQLLLWRAVCTMKETGCRRFDLGGLDPDLTPAGIRHFKEGLSGTPYRLTPEVEATGGGLVGRLVRWRVERARNAGQETRCQETR